MTIYQKFVNKFGERKAEELLEFCGKHTDDGIHEIPTRKSDKILYALTEALGWQCTKDNYGCISLTTKQCEGFLKENSRFVKRKHCADYLSLFAGRYDFLIPKTRKD